MRTLFPPFLACLVALFALFVLMSEDRTAPSGSGLSIERERISHLGQGLVQALVIRPQQQSDFETADTEIIKAQQFLKVSGYYSGPLDGRMNQRTRHALRSFQESRQLTVTGMIDNDTAQELGLTVIP
jgi:hypothetical protein